MKDLIKRVKGQIKGIIKRVLFYDEIKRFFRSYKPRRKFKKFFYERFSEPLHLNIISIFVALFGSFKSKIEFDLVLRQQNAFCLLKAAEFAKQMKLKSVTVIEFGVASGAGLINICRLAEKVTKETGVNFKIFGFDTGTGMPPARDYRDMPELYKEGSFPMLEQEKLLDLLPDNAKLIIGDIEETVPEFLKTISAQSPIGYIAVDVDYYWPAKSCLNVLLAESNKYLPWTLVYLDDISPISSNPWVGELLAVEEFNRENTYRKIHPYPALRINRIFKNARWIDEIFLMHVLDHKFRSTDNNKSDYISIGGTNLLRSWVTTKKQEIQVKGK